MILIAQMKKLKYSGIDEHKLQSSWLFNEANYPDVKSRNHIIFSFQSSSPFTLTLSLESSHLELSLLLLPSIILTVQACWHVDLWLLAFLTLLFWIRSRDNYVTSAKANLLASNLIGPCLSSTNCPWFIS